MSVLMIFLLSLLGSVVRVVHGDCVGIVTVWISASDMVIVCLGDCGF